jgi:hypothetical protein
MGKYTQIQNITKTWQFTSFIVQQHWPGTLAFDPVVGIFCKCYDLLVNRYKYKYQIVTILLNKNPS